ncbi:phytanoyl-CoA dioxygenase family protein [Allorhodopirellula heiligendammensis]|uniref:1-deoxypentalenic acid 11-beta-hydroxylase n=1 Tax=Allorhodopirellula heiligendammensis TaxID=2714739 RepID=A0A5C6C723_9BACT|nr:phytanoyl-CoA dioxygenase family protein [Allorhodopirellula heiligendammensis]TWU19948.1 1-deoxypentalenic acid 11-beta-hydroxylase [Allorhodopirellula heiligendammensis]
MPTNQQVADFHRDGYVLIPAVFDRDEMAGLLRYSKGDRALGAEAKTRQDASGGESRLAVRNELDEDSMYTAIACSRRVADPMEAFLGSEIYHYHHKMMLKEPRVGGAWEWHQDYGYWYNFGCLYPDMGSALLAVDRANRDNGCLQVLRGSHKMGRIDHGKAGQQVGADMQRVEQAMKHHELAYCEMQPGDVLFFHANLLHRSDKNESEHARWSLICCYNTRHNDPFITGKHASYSPLQRWDDARVRARLTSQQDAGL